MRLPAIPIAPRFHLRSFSILLPLVLGVPLWGEPAVYEGFSYPAGTSVLQQSGGSGFTGPWDSRSTVTGLTGSPVSSLEAAVVQSESLVYSDGVRSLVTTGGSLFLSGEYGNLQLARAIDPEALPHRGEDPKVGKTSYISFLARRSGEPANPEDPIYEGTYPYGDNLYPRAAGIGLFGWNRGNLRQLFFGNLSNRPDDVWRFTGEDFYGDERRDARSSTPFGAGEETRLVVVRIDHGGGGWHADRFSIWIDPNLAFEGANGSPIQFDWTSRDDPLYVQPAFIALEANDGDTKRPHAELSFDELRIGDSWEAVTPHTGGESWAGRPIIEGNELVTGNGFLGWVTLGDSWSYSWNLASWIYLPESTASEDWAWFYLAPGPFEPMPAAPEADSELLAYEGFDYSGSGDGAARLIDDALNGGFGWAGPWLTVNPNEIHNRAEVHEGSLLYQDAEGNALETSGGHAWISGIPGTEIDGSVGVNTQLRRNLSEPPTPEPGERIYLSFLGQRQGEPTNPSDPVWQNTDHYPDGYPFGDNLFPRGAGLLLHDQPTGGSNSAMIGNLSDQPENHWSFNSESTHIIEGTPFTDPAFVVVRLEYTAHQQPNMRGELIDRIGTIATVWLNPRNLLDEDFTDARQEIIYLDLVDPYELVLTGIGLEAGNDSYNRPVSEFAADEIRVGTDWDAVTPVIGGKPDRPAPETGDWAGFELVDGAYVYVGNELQWLHVGHEPWLYSYTLGTWIHLPEAWNPEGFWVFALDTTY